MDHLNRECYSCKVRDATLRGLCDGCRDFMKAVGDERRGEPLDE